MKKIIITVLIIILAIMAIIRMRYICIFKI